MTYHRNVTRDHEKALRWKMFGAVYALASMPKVEFAEGL
jgi:hypothetical protein